MLQTLRLDSKCPRRNQVFFSLLPRRVRIARKYTIMNGRKKALRAPSQRREPAISLAMLRGGSHCPAGPHRAWRWRDPRTANGSAQGLGSCCRSRGRAAVWSLLILDGSMCGQREEAGGTSRPRETHPHSSLLSHTFLLLHSPLYPPSPTPFSLSPSLPHQAPPLSH